VRNSGEHGRAYGKVQHGNYEYQDQSYHFHFPPIKIQLSSVVNHNVFITPARVDAVDGVDLVDKD